MLENGSHGLPVEGKLQANSVARQSVDPPIPKRFPNRIPVIACRPQAHDAMSITSGMPAVMIRVPGKTENVALLQTILNRTLPVGTAHGMEERARVLARFGAAVHRNDLNKWAPLWIEGFPIDPASPSAVANVVGKGQSLDSILL